MYEVIVGENPVNHETDTTDHYTQLVSVRIVLTYMCVLCTTYLSSVAQGNSTTKILYSSEIMRQSSCNYLQVISIN